MFYDFPSAPAYEGLTFLNVRPIAFNDRRTGFRTVFPVYRYRDDANGELVLVTEDRYEPLLDKLIAIGAFGAKGGRP